MHDAPSVLSPWSNFFVITGSSAGALTGLMFVVITLVSSTSRPTRNEATRTFSTPTVVHFCAALLISATLTVPWRSPGHAGYVLGLAGLFGIVYMSRVIHHQRRLTVYDPDLEDWTWYSILPMLAYLATTAGAILLFNAAADATFVLAGATVLLIFIGIHNAWDIVTYIAIDLANEEADSAAPAEREAKPAQLSAES